MNGDGDADFAGNGDAGLFDCGIPDFESDIDDGFKGFGDTDLTDCALLLPSWICFLSGDIVEFVPEVKLLSAFGLLSTLLWRDGEIFRELVNPTTGEFLDFGGEVGSFLGSFGFTTLFSPVTSGGGFNLFFNCLAVRVGLPIVFVAVVVTDLHFVAMSSLQTSTNLVSNEQ